MCRAEGASKTSTTKLEQQCGENDPDGRNANTASSSNHEQQPQRPQQKQMLPLAVSPRIGGHPQRRSPMKADTPAGQQEAMNVRGERGGRAVVVAATSVMLVIALAFRLEVLATAGLVVGTSTQPPPQTQVGVSVVG